MIEATTWVEPATVVELAWLAGLWDGEGSVGVTRAGQAAVQLSMTDGPTVGHAITIILKIGASGLGYSYREKHPERHRDAHYIRVNRLASIRLMARALVPYAVTKRRHWQLILEYVESRLMRADIDTSGRVRRGGRFQPKGRTEREDQLIEELCRLNQRGPRSSVRLFGSTQIS